MRKRREIPQPNTPTTEAKIFALSSEVLITFTPTDEMRVVKSLFWAQANEYVEPSEELTIDHVETYLPRNEANYVRAQWGKEGFRAWFSNRKADEAKADYLFGKALDALNDILVDRDPKNSQARVKAIQIVGELAGKFKKAADRKADEAKSRERQQKSINAMSQEELVALVQAKPQKEDADAENEAPF